MWAADAADLVRITGRTRPTTGRWRRCARTAAPAFARGWGESGTPRRARANAVPPTVGAERADARAGRAAAPRLVSTGHDRRHQRGQWRPAMAAAGGRTPSGAPRTARADGGSMSGWPRPGGQAPRR